MTVRAHAATTMQIGIDQGPQCASRFEYGVERRMQFAGHLEGRSLTGRADHLISITARSIFAHHAVVLHSNHERCRVAPGRFHFVEALARERGGGGTRTLEFR